MINIYAYTTIAYNERSWLKIGQTSQDPLVRIKEQDGTSNPEKLIHVKSWQVPDNISDIEVHMQLAKMGINKVRLDANREWFKCDISDVDCAINILIHDVNRSLSFDPREEQQKCIHKAIEYFKKGGTEFLINAKMRYGKTFVSYMIAKDLDAKNILILTYKPAVGTCWESDLKNHINFDGWAYSMEEGFIIDKKARVNVLFASYQDINDIKKKKWKNIQKHKWDLVIIDEMHYGSDTPRAKTTMDLLNIQKKLYVSGTPLDAMMSGRFNDDQIYNWTYGDEQRKRKTELLSGWATEIYRWLPDMKIYMYQVSDQAKKLCSHYSDEEQFTMTKMFASDDGVEFNDQAAVKNFIDQVFGLNVHKKNSVYRNPKIASPNHSLWVMPPSVKSVDAMVTMLEKMVGKSYHIINAAGNNGISKVCEITEIIRHDDHDKTITVTCGRFNTGVTIPEWDMVLMLGDGKAPETYFQTIFRVQSSDIARRKESCYVIDFNPERALELMFTYAENFAKKGQGITESLRDFLEFCPLLDNTSNEFKKVSAEDIVSFMQESGNYVDKFNSSYIFNKSESMNFTELLELEGAGISSIVYKKKLNYNDVVFGKNFNYLSQKKAEKLKKDITEEIIKKAKIITARIPEYLIVYCVKDTYSLLKTPKNDFEEHFGIKRDLFAEMVNVGFVNEERLNRIIAGFVI